MIGIFGVDGSDHLQSWLAVSEPSSREEHGARVHANDEVGVSRGSNGRPQLPGGPPGAGRGKMAGPRRPGVVLEPEPREPGRTGLARVDLVQMIADASNDLRVLVDSKPPPKASVVAEHRNRLSSLEASLREHDDLAKEEAKVSELRVLQRELQALQKAVISRSLESTPQDGLRTEDVCKMADAVEEENAALREILEIRRSEIARQCESGEVTAMETENRRLHLK